MNSFRESITYYGIKAIAVFIRLLPVSLALAIGRFMGMMAYIFDVRHKTKVYSNLKIAFADTKTPHEIRAIMRESFQNFGQNVVELMRMPLMTQKVFDKYIVFEGKENLKAVMDRGKGAILLAMHFGSWELASVGTALTGYPYKVIVNPQKRFTRLDALMNEYREHAGTVIIERGFGVREFVKSLRNNEMVGMVVDQGGRDGVLVPFFGREASMSSGAIRMALRLDAPICLAVIVRQKGPYHKIILQEPFKLESTGDIEQDVRFNLTKITKIMEDYIRQYPAEYMWFYKIWKYSRQSVTAILHDGRTGHLRQSQSVANVVARALAEQGFQSSVKILNVNFRNKYFARCLSFLSVMANAFVYHGRLGFLRWFLTPESYREINSVKADFVISCGSTCAAINHLISTDLQAKSIVILKPGLLNFNRFDLVVLPEHDRSARMKPAENVIFTVGAPNLITEEYLQEQASLLLKRFSHLQLHGKYKIGVLIGGDTKSYSLSESIIRIVINQLKEVVGQLDADILLTTSRRTSEKVEGVLIKELKKHPHCPLLIPANKNNVPEAVGGILGLADIVVVSSDSVSMISEAASSKRKTVVFHVPSRMSVDREQHKHTQFMDKLNAQNYILATDAKNLAQAVCDLAKNKIQTRPIDDQAVVLSAVRQVI